MAFFASQDFEGRKGDRDFAKNDRFIKKAKAGNTSISITFQNIVKLLSITSITVEAAQCDYLGPDQK